MMFFYQCFYFCIGKVVSRLSPVLDYNIYPDACQDSNRERNSFASYLENDMAGLIPSASSSAFPRRKILEELLEDAAWTGSRIACGRERERDS